MEPQSVLEIDGAFGEGGGQIVRSSLALSMLTGRPIRIRNVRARRSKPGLMRQHLTAVRAARQLSNGIVEGDETGSTNLYFSPGPVRSGEYTFRTGSAGSTTLVLQTVLPALLRASGRSLLQIEGGTHNPLAPPFEFMQQTYLPLIGRFGPHVTADLGRAGFYPAGGGVISVAVKPCADWTGIQLLDRGPVRRRSVRALVANLPFHIAERECRTIAELSGWEEACFHPVALEGVAGPGNIVLIELECEALTEVFAATGAKGVPAEEVARRAWCEAAEYESSGVPVGPHLADQLVLPCGLAALQGRASAFRTTELSLHATTHLELMSLFLPITTAIDRESDGSVTVSFRDA